MAIIQIPGPSMAVHSHDVPGWKYGMYNTWFLGAGEEMQHIADWTTSVATATYGLRCLIFNSHGNKGYAKLSDVAYLRSSETSRFGQMNGLVDHILIIACKVIGVQPGDNAGFWSDPGVQLCYALAQATLARVYASNQTQYVDLFATLFGGFGDIDDYEGDLLLVRPDGNCSWLESNFDLRQELHRA